MNGKCRAGKGNTIKDKLWRMQGRWHNYAPCMAFAFANADTKRVDQQFWAFRAAAAATAAGVSLE